MIDLHNHMLPGLDDGASNAEEALSMARVAVDDGIRGVVCTPHWVPGHFENTRPVVLEAVKAFREALKAHGIPLDIYPGSELRLSHDVAERIESGELLTFNDTGRYALLELYDEMLPPNMADFFYKLQLRNITPILSHPERNPVIHRDPTRLNRWLEAGILIQITSSSLLGRFGSGIRKLSVTLLRHGMVHAVASDAHGTNARAPRLSSAYEEVSRLAGRETADRVLLQNPELIIRGEPVVQSEIIPLGAKPSRSPSWKNLFPFLRRTTR